MTTRDGALFVHRQIESILAHLRSQDELIVSDDASQDSTVAIVEQFRDSRIRLFRNRFGTATQNFEFVLGQARGNAIFLADQDDVWLEGKVAETCQALERHALVVSDCAVTDAEGRVLAESYFDLVGSRPGLLRNFWRNSYLGCCMALRRELLDAVLPIPADVAHDYWIGMLAELIDEPYFLRRKLLLYRRHGSTASFAAGKSGRALRTRVQSRITLAVRLAGRLWRLKAAGRPLQSPP